ncbi:hypothetical protein ACLX1H_011298 [Fusarium chlamydosporum]
MLNNQIPTGAAHYPVTLEPIDQPHGVPVANGMTKDCSHWLTHEGSLSCTQICLAYEVSINLFTEINPSLNKTSCDADLVLGNAYCLKPVAGWDRPAPAESITPGVATTTTKAAAGTKTATATTSVIHISTSAPSHSPEQPGIIDGCDKWHYVDNGDGCYSIAEKYNIKLSNFYSWNPKVGDDCSGLWLHYYVCVGVKS